MVNAVVFLVLVLLCIISFMIFVVNAVRWGLHRIRHKDCINIRRIIKKNGIVFMAILIIICIFVFITQAFASTPKIRDKNGDVIKGGIAELRDIELNGHKEWISIRGVSKDAPILLFLAGGPGGTQMAATRYELSELEKNFVVVNWEQPGSGKSYNCMKRSNITIQTYIDDGIALTEYLRERFGQDKIYLVGESWGSALGIFLADARPEYYAGVIGTGQMVDFKETEKIDYAKAMEIAESKGDEATINKLLEQGEAPYNNGNIALKSATYLNYISEYMTKDPNITNGGYNTFRDMFASEYGILDSINYMLGVMNTFNVVYPQLYEVDLRKSYAKIDVPVYFFLGRHDINAPTSLAEEYYNLLEAPEKELIWFEHSGHSPWLNETDLFVQETLRVFDKK